VVLRARPQPALIVPDELSWTVWGADPAARGLTPATGPEEARGLLVPEVVPASLAGPLAAELARVPARPRVIAERGPAVDGEHVAELLQRAFRPAGHEAGAHDDHGEHGEHGEHGHDMMAIVGDPSSDGLVMEPIELELGPLSWLLPGGLVASLRLDGDLVASCELRSTLVAANGHGTPAADPLAPVAWATAAAVAGEEAAGTTAPATVAWRRIAAVELERAVSHLAWLRALGRLLGWAAVVTRAQRALAPVLEVRRERELDGAPITRDAEPAERSPDHASRLLSSAAKRAGKLAAVLDGHRLATRARGRGHLDAAPSLVGPNARGAGSPRDARSTDPLYAELGFAPVVRDAGDAEARVLVRAHEVVASVELAKEALARAAAREGGFEGIGFASPAGAAVEGPRGSVLASVPRPGAPPIVAAPGAKATGVAAAAAATGQEWSTALLTIASFDLSGWRVPG
jgi:Ni,Fe-hydrogenase III large subunit